VHYFAVALLPREDERAPQMLVDWILIPVGSYRRLENQYLRAAP